MIEVLSAIGQAALFLIVLAIACVVLHVLFTAACDLLGLNPPKE